MVTALKRTVQIKPGGVIEIKAPELPVGANAEVIVLLGAQQDRSQNPFSILKAAPAGCFKSAEEIDTFIRGERDAWAS
jgi:hypothetical protein